MQEFVANYLTCKTLDSKGHFLVCMELGRVAKCGMREKYVIRK